MNAYFGIIYRCPDIFQAGSSSHKCNAKKISWPFEQPVYTTSDFARHELPIETFLGLSASKVFTLEGPVNGTRNHEVKAEFKQNLKILFSSFERTFFQVRKAFRNESTKSIPPTEGKANSNPKHPTGKHHSPPRPLSRSTLT